MLKNPIINIGDNLTYSMKIKLKLGIEVDCKSWKNVNKDMDRINRIYKLTIDSTTKKSLRKVKRDLKRLTYEGYMNPSDYYEWASNVKERDRSCQICHSDENLHAHHIIYRSIEPLLQYNINNGITLCVKCHAEAHTKEPAHRLILSKRKATPLLDRVSHEK